MSRVLQPDDSWDMGKAMKLTERHGSFLLSTATALWMVYPALKDLLRSSQQGELYSHIALIPFVSAYLFYVNRKTIFSDPRYSYVPGIALSVIGLILYLTGTNQQSVLSQNDHAALTTLSALLFWAGSFLLLYGTKAFRAATFPILFLLFMVPIPSALMNPILSFLQVGSARISHLLFLLIGMPFSREGLVFQLPGVSIKVAEQCSGIRSSLALLITSVLAAHVFLRGTWRRAAFMLSVLPIALFKNAVRIVTISWLSVYVDRRILEGGFLHKSGGFLFFALGLVILGAILILLRRIGEDDDSSTKVAPAGDTAYSPLSRS